MERDYSEWDIEPRQHTRPVPCWALGPAMRMVSMPEQPDRPKWQSSASGEQRWKEARERVAARNAEASAAGKRRTQAYQLAREERRRAAAASADAALRRRGL